MSAMVPTRHRVQIAVAVGIAELIIKLLQVTYGSSRSDFGQIWYASRAALAGHNPYALVGPGLAFDWPAPLVYPLTAAVAAAPLAALPQNLANVVFCGVAAGLLAWALCRTSYWPLLGLCSYSAVTAFRSVQWAPIFAAAVVLPPLSFLLVAKPTIGAAIFVARPSRWAVIGAAVLGPAAFLLQPDWMQEWVAAVQRDAALWSPADPYRLPLLLPGGFLVVLCLARWRRTEARLVLALACVPQSLWPYDMLPLYLVPRTAVESVVLVVLGGVVALLTPSLAQTLAPAATLDGVGGMTILLLYLPVTIMVLRRPNEGTIPTWIERRVNRWPGWLRGEPRKA
jgi:hypothetical protein